MLFYITAVAYLVLVWFLIKRESEVRVAAAFLLAPLAPCLLVATSEGVLGLIFIPFSYMFAVVGVPVYFLFRRLGWLKIWHVVLASAALGGVVAFAFGFVRLSFDGDAARLYNALPLAGYGALTGLVFWLIAFSGRRTNNSFRPTPHSGAA